MKSQAVSAFFQFQLSAFSFHFYLFYIVDITLKHLEQIPHTSNKVNARIHRSYP